MELELFETSWMDVWNGAEPTEPVGAIFTKLEVTNLILDLAGYRPEKQRLAHARILEPSCGDGAFLQEIVRRLIESERKFDSTVNWEAKDLDRAIIACDLNSGFVELARRQVSEQLRKEGCAPARAKDLAESWVLHTDFLLSAWDGKFEFVVGNPPYVRIEELPPRVLQRYRELFRTCVERADLYVAFFEKGLSLLSPKGRLGYICANRFAKNAYGRAMRDLIARQFHVRYFLNLEHTQPFVSDVSAYPCVIVIDRDRGQPTKAATLTDVLPGTLETLKNGSGDAHPQWETFPSWYQDGSPWLTTTRTSYGRLQDLARQCPLLEDSASATKIGIGVATGADRVFVLDSRRIDIEATCLLPLVMAADISPERVAWSGHYLVNPFNSTDDGTLRDFADYPGLAAYFDSHRDTLKARHTAKKRSEGWYRTIDRVTHSLTSQPKLVIPDIQNGGVVGYDAGHYYPHHNVYWITSGGWNLRALQALIRSSMVLEQIKAFSVQMRGGAIRYQAQVLRRIRIPFATSLSEQLLAKLASVAASPLPAEIDEVAQAAFDCSNSNR